jgi:succinyl-CoA synthetase alpha subunit
MLVARELTRAPGVTDASVVMATEANKALLEQAGLLTPAAKAAGANDLVLAVNAKDDASAQAALETATRLLAQKTATATTSGVARPRSVRAAARAAGDANLAVVSVAGQYAAAQAWDALRAGMHVLLFSDHVSVEDEVALKAYARDHGLLLMGPGAGTAILNGVGLGFANAMLPGPVGIVAAAGTGLQEVSTLLGKAGVGLTQGIGTGGRDVSEKVGGTMMLASLQALQADPATKVIVVVSKVPSSVVVERVIQQVERSDKPTVLALMGAPSTYKLTGPRYQVPTLREAAALAVALARGESLDAARQALREEDDSLAQEAKVLKGKLAKGQRYARGLFSGGTLCEETMRLWGESLGQVWSNAPLDASNTLKDSLKSQGHCAVDLGEEEFTQGRPHPMIDNDLRVRRILQEARDPSVAVLMLDVVIGHGAHPDPASELGPAITQARQVASAEGRELVVITSVTGTEQDPQCLSRQAETLRRAGAVVKGSNAAAARLAGLVVQG